jgi:hypothetical protein
MVDEYLAWRDDPDAYPDYASNIPEKSFSTGPHMETNQKAKAIYLAPFYDSDGDGVYRPELGDYPYYDLTGELCQTLTPTADATYYHGNDPNSWLYGILSDQVIKGDQTLWWVFNDKGNIHTETGGDAIGLEIRGQAFAFATNDEINNMTFYSYEVINRSTFTLRETYFSQWVDPDLGHYLDDYIGCDVQRGLGYCYNGTPVDGTGQPWAYGAQPPAIGVDFFQGPYMDRIEPGQPLYGQDRRGAFDAAGNLLPCDFLRELHYPEAINGVNFGDGIANNERFGMRRFTYFNNTTAGAQPWQTDPQVAIDYYNYLRGIWKDGERMVYGGNGHPTDSWDASVFSDFLFPGDSDPCHWGTGFQTPAGPTVWTEETANNPVNDRRFLQSAGPFTLRPGAVNYITVGIPWARAAAGGPWASVELLRIVDDKCQALFDNCFQVLDGPNAPDLTFRELDGELIVYITNRRTNDKGNNFNEEYTEFDYNIPDFYIRTTTTNQPISPGSDTVVVISTTDTVFYDRDFRFEGYKIYQLRSASVSAADVKDPNLARLVFQTDVKNGVGKIVNNNFDQSLGFTVPVMEVNGADQGIRNSFRVNQDAFTNEPLVNHKQYYYLAVAYAFNEYEKYTTDPQAQNPGVQSLNGQKTPYLAGRRNIRTYTAIPHKPIGPVAPNSRYGDGLEVTRVQGQGSVDNIIDLTEETIAEILSKPPADSTRRLGHPDYPIAYNATYQAGRGPINVKIVDPLNIKSAEFTLRFDSLYHITKTNITGSSASAPGGDTAGMQISTWRLINETTGQIYESAQSIEFQKEQLFLDLGISISMKQVFYPGSYVLGRINLNPVNGDSDPHFEVIAENNGFLEASIEFEDITRPWLFGIPDIDGGGPFNWIRSGTLIDSDDNLNNDWNMIGIGNSNNRSWDPQSVYENVLGGTWAPYKLLAFGPKFAANGSFVYSGSQSDFAPAFTSLSKDMNKMTDLANVDIVFTSDKSLWTRCPVIETSYDHLLSENNTFKYHMRSAPSVDKDGNSAAVGAEPSSDPNNPAFISATGMGWFPGYAINIETGERLNIMFGENSWLVGENGRDMLWNPTANIANDAGVVFGGMHYIWVMAHTKITRRQAAYTVEFYNPAYDAGASLVKQLNAPRHPFIPPSILHPMELAWATAMWVNIPIVEPEFGFLSNDVKVRLRVAKPFAKHFSMPVDTAYMPTAPDMSTPVYKFSTEAQATILDDKIKAENDLDLINIVPNPYRAYSTYETNQLDNRVKITNLPRKCEVTIYTMNGTLIRQYTKDSPITSIDWDLKNYAGIPIAGGLYIIHVTSEGLGERTIKWFGSLRPIDLNSF